MIQTQRQCAADIGITRLWQALLLQLQLKTLQQPKTTLMNVEFLSSIWVCILLPSCRKQDLKTELNKARPGRLTLRSGKDEEAVRKLSGRLDRSLSELQERS